MGEVVGVGCLDGASRYHFLYPRWYNMLYRCYNQNSKDYSSYGAKGVKVCDAWKSFKTYIDDVTSLPSYNETLVKNGELHLDKDFKIAENKLYSPETCIWIGKNANVSASYRTIQISQKRFFATRLSDGYSEYAFSQRGFAKKYNLTRSKIGEVLSGKYSSHKGWTFEWK